MIDVSVIKSRRARPENMNPYKKFVGRRSRGNVEGRMKKEILQAP